MVRFDTYNASAHFVRQLEQSGKVEVVHDGGDNLLVQLISGEMISVYLIETVIPPYEIKLTIADNNAAGIYTLFVIWADMFLQENNSIITPDEWMTALYTLYGDKVYAFSVYGKDIHIFPVYFERHGRQERVVRYGADVNVANFGCDVRYVSEIQMLQGAWRIADFDHPSADGSPNSQQKQRTKHNHQQKNGTSATPQKARTPWEVLGIDVDTDQATVKRVYRRLARQYHPDTNPSADATNQMQHLNEAYDLIMRSFEQARKHEKQARTAKD
jgi:hypothetical protein